MKIEAKTVEQFEHEYRVGKEPLKCDFCRENKAQFTVSHEKILMADFAGNSGAPAYFFCGQCFFHNIGHFLRMIREEI